MILRPLKGVPMSSPLRSTLAIFVLMLSFLSFCPSSRATTPSVGDIFIGVGKGQYLWYTFNGTNYVLVQAITVGGSTDQTSGCAFDSQLNLYVTNTTSGQVFELNSSSLSLAQTL